MQIVRQLGSIKIFCQAIPIIYKNSPKALKFLNKTGLYDDILHRTIAYKIS